jgi:hypothetical protein
MSKHPCPTFLSIGLVITESSLLSSQLFNADPEVSSTPTDIKVPSSLAHAGTPLSSTPPDGTESTPLTKDYSATGGSEAPLAVVSGTIECRSSPYRSTPAAGRTPFHDVPPSVPTEDPYAMPRPLSRSRSSRPLARHPRRDTIYSVQASLYDTANWAPPWSIRLPVCARLSRFAMVLGGEVLCGTSLSTLPNELSMRVSSCVRPFVLTFFSCVLLCLL